jgi:hypothetical protein
MKVFVSGLKLTTKLKRLIKRENVGIAGGQVIFGYQSSLHILTMAAQRPIHGY